MFEEAKLKLERGDQHIEEFFNRTSAYGDSHWYQIKNFHDSKAKTASVQLRMVNAPPRQLATVIGDAIHNIRAALDVAFYDLVVRLKCTPTIRTMFPIPSNASLLSKALKDGGVEHAEDLHILLRDEIRSYSGGDEYLGPLHLLDIIDKHRALLPSLYVARIHGIAIDSVTPNGRNSFRLGSISGELSMKNHLNIAVASGPVRFSITRAGVPQVQFRFGEGAPFASQPVAETLQRLSTRVLEVLEKLERFVELRSQLT